MLILINNFSLDTVVGLFVWSVYEVDPKGNYPKYTNLLLLNWVYYLLVGAWFFALEICLKQALNFNIKENDLATLFTKIWIKY